MKIWTKRAAGVSAIIGGLLVAGSVAANAADLPVVSSLPLVGGLTGGQQQAAPAVPQHTVTPMKAGAAKRTASAKHETSNQTAVRPQDARPGYGGGDEGDDSRSIVLGNGSGNKTIVGTGNTNVNAPVNVCGNPVNGPLGVAATAACDNQQDNLAAGSASSGDDDGDSIVIGSGSGLDTETLLGNTNTNTPLNTCANPVNSGGLLTEAACKNRQRNLSVGHAG